MKQIINWYLGHELPKYLIKGEVLKFDYFKRNSCQSPPQTGSNYLCISLSTIIKSFGVQPIV
ncbi:hypothetical protein EV194_109105 [Natronoflexus pectinivorans]|uniref:Uncharacterized protein n=1 Tax=Natronoflexus pectinivorans TaxID=682526 RepID=A0A4R2GIY7_9BACT|nr:hypothetical protein EV194_109105 [Natronoflexus pectinivorans]